MQLPLAKLFGAFLTLKVHICRYTFILRATRTNCTLYSEREGGFNKEFDESL